MKKEKFNESYIGNRSDIELLVPNTVDKVLDVGCSIGTLGASIKEKTRASVIGIEISEDMATEARKRLDEVFVGDASKIILNEKLADHKFDCIIFADVLEHLVDPWITLKKATTYLTDNGVIIASIPNIRHISTITSLVFQGYWPYRERGIHDKTHLRFFTKKNIYELFQQANLKINILNANYRIIERPHKINKYAKILSLPGIRNFFTFQYIVKSSKANNIIKK